uniref:Uncharacterized protein n=1 Tax=Peronospora matthiolae TaxID=2874970 RepID=A0AAV1TPC9_9STRA
MKEVAAFWDDRGGVLCGSRALVQNVQSLLQAVHVVTLEHLAVYVGQSGGS